MIAVIDSFIESKHLEELQNLVSAATLVEVSHTAHGHRYSVPSKAVDSNDNLISFLSSFTKNIGDAIADHYKKEVFSETDFSVSVYCPGEMLNPHYDAMPDDRFKHLTPNGNGSRDISSVLYLNDNYTGGEICFPFINLSIKPDRGCLLLFPAGEKYTHSVNEVLSGQRYVVPQFWCFK